MVFTGRVERSERLPTCAEFLESERANIAKLTAVYRRIVVWFLLRFRGS